MLDKILIIERDPDILAEYKALLESYDYDVITAESLLEGENAIRMENPEAVLANLDNSDADMYGFCSRYHLFGMGILAIGCIDSAEASVKALKAGADDHLPKSCVPEEIVLRLQALLRRKHNPLPVDNK